MKFLVFLFFIFLFDFYVFFSLKSLYKKRKSKKVFLSIYLASWLLLVITIVLLFSYLGSGKLSTNPLITFFIGTSFIFMITKIIIAFVLIIEDVYRFIRFSLKSIQKKELSKENIDSRRKFVATIAYGIAAVPFLSLFYGIAYGKYDFRIHKQKLRSSRLPANFKGLRIVQLSDIHIGSFDNKTEVQKGFDMVQELNPDLLLFTGDFVNNLAEELEGYEEILTNLSAKYGKFSILGNHDYGEYMSWESEEAKDANFKKLERIQKEMGFTLLKNEHARIEIEGESIELVGVENWGKPPFPQYGDLDKALKGTIETNFKILMSHDPDHWEAKTLKHSAFIDLTLSGHTHGTQMGIEIPGFRWSPAQYRYDRWAGRYEEGNQVLYVNRGFGYLGYPGRVGIWPEITLIELETED